MIPLEQSIFALNLEKAKGFKQFLDGYIESPLHNDHSLIPKDSMKDAERMKASIEALQTFMNINVAAGINLIVIPDQHKPSFLFMATMMLHIIAKMPFEMAKSIMMAAAALEGAIAE